MITGKNYYGQDTPDVDGETEFTRCNFSWPSPVDSGGSWVGVRVFPGDDTPRTFIRCNLVNCEIPPGSTMIRCNKSIIRRNIVVSTETIYVDDDEILLETRAHVCYGRQTEPGVYEYYPTPHEDPSGPEE